MITDYTAADFNLGKMLRDAAAQAYNSERIIEEAHRELNGQLRMELRQVTQENSILRAEVERLRKLE